MKIVRLHFLLKVFFSGLLCLVLALQGRATTYNNYGTATNYNLTPGDTLHILSGTYTGTLWSFSSGAVINVAADATFQPANVGNPRGKLINRGTALFASAFNTNYDFYLDNYGTMQVFGVNDGNGVVMYGNQIWVNHFGASLEITHAVKMYGGETGSVLRNEGRVRVGALHVNGGTSLVNKNRVVVNGPLRIEGGMITNEGEIDPQGGIVMINGNSTNSCRLIADGGFESYNTVFHNTGLLWIPFTPSAPRSANTFRVGGTFIAHPNSTVKAPNLDNYGTITSTGGGISYFYFTDETYNYGTVGGAPADGTIEVFDATRMSPTRIFDFYYSSAPVPIHPNVGFSAMPEPDALRMVPSGCSDLFTPIPMPLTWLSFSAMRKAGAVELAWETAQEINTDRFVIERSANGQVWNPIGTIQSNNSTSKNQYRFTDYSPLFLNYYRIRQVDLDDKFTYSTIRRVQFTAIEDNLVVYPTIVANRLITCIVKNKELLNANQVRVLVYDASGKMVYNKRVKPASKVFISCAGWPVGYYTIRVGNEADFLQAKVLVK